MSRNSVQGQGQRRYGSSSNPSFPETTGVELVAPAGDPPEETSVRRAESLRSADLRWKLTTRQTQVLELVARGLTNDLIAEVLGIGRGTVEFHVSAIFDKAGVSNRATLIARLLEF